MFDALKVLFTDPIFQIPFWGSLFICSSCALMGTLVFVQRKTLIGETLSHAAYLGMALGGWIAYKSLSSFSLFLGGILASLLAWGSIEYLVNRKKVDPDAAFSLVLSSFWAFSVLVLSRLQFSQTEVFREVKTFLFGQAATLSEEHFWMAASFFVFLSLFLWVLFYPIQMTLFDPVFAKSVNIPRKFFSFSLLGLLVVAMIIGMRCVGVVLMVGMFIAPPVFARQFSSKLSTLLVGAVSLGAISAFLGNFLPLFIYQFYGEKWSVPSGPLMVCIASLGAIGALLFAPKRGYGYRLFHHAKFQLRCYKENILKCLYKYPGYSKKQLQEKLSIRSYFLYFFLKWLSYQGWIQRKPEGLFLTLEGTTKALHIIRLHRLWELYLADQMKIEISKVHSHAEKMEHILTEDLEERLDAILSNPKKDPHNQPIPRS